MSYLNLLKVMALGLMIFLPFQNCGQDYSTSKESYFTGSDFENTECLSDVVDCGPQAEFLQISIDLENPMSFKGISDAQIVGRCNDGNYPQHTIYWEIRDTATLVKASGNVPSGCVDGLYSLVLNINQASIPAGHSYSVFVKIIGIDSEGSRFYNIQANGTAEIDFTK